MCTLSFTPWVYFSVVDSPTPFLGGRRKPEKRGEPTETLGELHTDSDLRSGSKSIQAETLSTVPPQGQEFHTLLFHGQI